ncbi:NAC domain-containing protein 89-like [Impatiens glandulifera]|uniref:NAC domain-containing protein 89-like n=1 Tax=Impatiens glandulifera TaxID=253017 RepID=UPI001FB099FB|nr:NAC domain-containing protein 89-like [Impatiens glandulifera]
MAAQTPIQKLKWLVPLPSIFPGFRFSPTDGELVHYYLNKKIQGLERSVYVIPEIDFNKFEPWDLPDMTVMQSNLEWFFFTTRGNSYLKGSQSARTTQCGYWKTLGKESNVKYASKIIGKKSTLFFYIGHPPRGQKTGWFMHEFSSVDKQVRTNGEMIDTRLPHFGEEWRINEHPKLPLALVQKLALSNNNNITNKGKGFMMIHNSESEPEEAVHQIVAVENPMSKSKQVAYYDDDDEFCFDNVMTDDFMNLFNDESSLMPNTNSLPFASYANEFEGIINGKMESMGTFQIPSQDAAAIVDNWYDLEGWPSVEPEQQKQYQKKTGGGGGDNMFLDNMNINTNIDYGFGSMMVVILFVFVLGRSL